MYSKTRSRLKSQLCIQTIYIFLNLTLSFQVPLCSVLLSGKRRRDHKKVLDALKLLLPGVPEIRGIVIDYQSAIWPAVQEIFPDAHINGCLFHWNQTFWRKVQNFGLQTETQKFTWKCMALPCLLHKPTSQSIHFLGYIQ